MQPKTAVNNVGRLVDIVSLKPEGKTGARLKRRIAALPADQLIESSRLQTARTSNGADFRPRSKKAGPIRIESVGLERLL